MRAVQNVSHYSTLPCQALSPCGTFYAACSDSGMVAMWRVESMLMHSDASPAVILCPFNGQPVTSLTSTERFLIASCVNGEVVAWLWKELAAGNNNSSWNLHVGRPDEKIQINWISTNKNETSCDNLVLGCGDSAIYVYDMETRDQVSRLTGHTDYVHSVDCTDGSAGVSIVSGGEDGAVKLWDTRKAQPSVFTFVPDSESELRRPNGKFISSVSTARDWLVCGGGPTASLWNISTRIMSSKLPPEHEGIRATHIVEETIFVGGQSTTIHMSNYGGEECGRLNVNSSCIYSIVTDQSKDLLFATGSSSAIDVFSIKSNAKLKTLNFPN